MKKIVIMLLVLLPIAVSAQVKFSEIPMDKALKKAKSEKKGLLVDVVSGRVDNDNIAKVFTDKELERLVLDNFIPVRIDFLKPENDSFIKYIANLAYPVMIFLNADGERLAFGHWDEIVAGRQDLGKIVRAAIEQREVKNSNTRQIKFLDLDYAQALELAAGSGKPLFVDCHFVGCGPCRKMEADVFTLDRVADFYNENFVCIKLDRDKDSHGVISKYKVTAYPTFLFINGDDSLILKEDGGRDGDDFIELGQRALAKLNGGDMGDNTIALANSASTSATVSTNDSAGVATVPEGGIAFRKLSLNEAIGQAKRENKVIYADMSARWCRPCKMMKQTTFVDPDVVEYMNRNFVSIYFECDTDGAMSEEYRERYSASAFPTHLIIDSEGGLLHKFVGYMKPATFLDELRKGITEKKGLQYYSKRYVNGERSQEFMSEYITMLANANEGAAAADIATEYLKMLPFEELTDRKNFFFVHEFVHDLDSPLAQRIIANRKIFDDAISQGDVDEYIRMLWIIKGMSFIRGEGADAALDKQGYETFLKRLDSSNLNDKDYIKIITMLDNARRLGNWGGYVDIAIEYMKKNKENANPMYTCNWGLDLAAGCNDKVLREKYAKALKVNFELVKGKERELGQVWGESMNVLLEQLSENKH